MNHKREHQCCTVVSCFPVFESLMERQGDTRKHKQVSRSRNLYQRSDQSTHSKSVSSAPPCHSSLSLHSSTTEFSFSHQSTSQPGEWRSLVLCTDPESLAGSIEKAFWDLGQCYPAYLFSSASPSTYRTFSYIETNAAFP